MRRLWNWLLGGSQVEANLRELERRIDRSLLRQREATEQALIHLESVKHAQTEVKRQTLNGGADERRGVTRGL